MGGNERMEREEIMRRKTEGKREGDDRGQRLWGEGRS